MCQQILIALACLEVTGGAPFGHERLAAPHYSMSTQHRPSASRLACASYATWRSQYPSDDACSRKAFETCAALFVLGGMCAWRVWGF